MITAEEARKKIIAKLYETDNMQRFFRLVEEAIDDNKFEFQSRDDYSDNELDLIKKLGYERDYDKFSYYYTFSIPVNGEL